MIDPATLVVGEIEEVDLRTVFAHEAHTFSPWLARPENLNRLGTALGIGLEPVSTETSTGIFRIDLVARDTADDSLVVVENQFSRSDHDHLGKALTYLAAKHQEDAKTVVWIAESFADEHRAVLDWLNDTTGDRARFYAVIPKLLRIGGSATGLRFDVVVAPNAVKKASNGIKFTVSNYIKETRSKYWPLFFDALTERSGQALPTRHGGGLGHMYVFPDDRCRDAIPRIGPMPYLNLSEEGDDFARIGFSVREDRYPDHATRIKRVRELAETAMAANGIDPDEPVDMSSVEAMRLTADTHVAATVCWLEATQAVYGDPSEDSAANGA